MHVNQQTLCYQHIAPDDPFSIYLRFNNNLSTNSRCRGTLQFRTMDGPHVLC